MGRRAGCSALVVALLAIPLPSSATASIDGDAFLARIAAARALAVDAASHPSPEGMEQVRMRLDLPVEVSVRWGSVWVAPDAVLQSLRGVRTGEFRVAIEQLDALALAARDALAATPADPDGVAAALERAYVGVRADPTILERMTRLLGAAFTWIVGRLGNVASVGGVIAWAALIGVLIGLMLLLRRLGLVPEIRTESPGAPRAPTPTDWVRLAEEAQRAGHLNNATRLYFRAVIARLALMGVVSDSPSVTAGEAQAATAVSLPRAASSVKRAAAVFERAAYAHGTIEPADLEVVREAERVVALR